MNQIQYTLEQDRAGIKVYYISRIEWTPDLAAATLFQNPKHCRDEIQILPDSVNETDIVVRTIHLIPGDTVQ